MRSLAVEWGNRGIRMNAIAPGPIPTERSLLTSLTPTGAGRCRPEAHSSDRFGTVDELADLAAFLMSDHSSYINGEVIRMDGGELLQGAGEFTQLGRLLREEEWETFKARKTAKS